MALPTLPDCDEDVVPSVNLPQCGSEGLVVCRPPKSDQFGDYLAS